MDNRNRVLLNRMNHLQSLKPKQKGGWYWFWVIFLSLIGFGLLMAGVATLIMKKDTENEEENYKLASFYYLGSSVPVIGFAVFLMFRKKT